MSGDIDPEFVVESTSSDGVRHTQTLRLAPVPTGFAEVYRRRGLPVPDATSPHDPAALWPYEPRGPHEQYARAAGYFWLPCVLCTRPYGGHEIVDSIPDPTGPENMFIGICPACTAERNGGFT